MNLGIITSPREESFIQAKENGLDFLEFTINAGDDGKDFGAIIDDIKKWMNDYDISIGSIGRWKSDRIDREGNIIEEELEICYRLIDVASELKCTNFVSGCNYIEVLSYYENCSAAINFFSKLIAYGKTRGVKISAATCHKNNFVNNHMAWTMIHGYLEELGIKYDPSHSIYAGQDYLKEARDWGHRFYHVHLKGSFIIDGERFDDPPAGLDETNWSLFMSILYAKNYDGGLSIEPHSPHFVKERGEKGIKYTIEYFRKMMF